MKKKLPWSVLWNKGLAFCKRYRYALLVIGVGLLLLVWPSGKGGEPEASPPLAETVPAEDFSVEALEKKLAETLSKVEGAGNVTVVLTVQGGAKRVLAQDGTSSYDADGGSESQRSTVVLSGGSGKGEEAVLVQQLYPKFQGALVVCPGGGRGEVRLKLMEAVSALTGLGADKISICKGKG